MELKRVVVTGLGALTPLGNNVKDYWENLVNGVSGSDIITRFNPEKLKTKFACEVRNFDPNDFFDRREARKLDLYSQFALVSSDQAVKDSGIDADSIDKARVGVIVGSGIGGFGTFFEEVIEYLRYDKNPRFTPYFIPKIISDIASGHISIKYGFMGPNYATVSACATSTNAIIDAFNLIRLNKADVFITGGSEASVNEVGIGGFNAMQAISTKNDEYKTASRPFDKTRDGFVIGEGAGILILEELEHAKKRGAKIYAEMIGAGMSADAYHITAPHPEGLGAFYVMSSALEDAEINHDDVDYINVHGTATPRGDIAEAKAIINVFKDHAYKMHISSTKSMTGHLLGAAGAVEAIAAILAIVNNVIPPTINFTTPDPEIDNKLNFTFNKAQEREVNVSLSNTFGFGGHNSSVVFKKFTE
jgi:3-oxoacyl-[acyl-carrier-protein] synthase II